jgi:hypothetical protein
MNKFIDINALLKLNQEDINYPCRCITGNEIEEVIKSLPTEKRPGLDDSLLNSTKP